MANRLKLLGVTYLIGKIKFKLLFHGPLAEQDLLSLREDFGWLNSDQLHGLCSWQSEGRVGEIHLLAVVLFHVLGFTVRLLLCLKKIYIYVYIH